MARPEINENEDEEIKKRCIKMYLHFRLSLFYLSSIGLNSKFSYNLNDVVFVCGNGYRLGIFSL